MIADKSQLSFYIATRGDAAGIARMRALAEKLIALGYYLYYDWSKDIEAARAAGYLDDKDVPPEVRKKNAQNDLDAAINSRFLIYLTPPVGVKSEGAASELTGAIAAEQVRESLGFSRKQTTIVIGKASTIFASLANYHFDHDEDAVEFLASNMRLLSVLR